MLGCPGSTAVKFLYINLRLAPKVSSLCRLWKNMIDKEKRNTFEKVAIKPAGFYSNPRNQRKTLAYHHLIFHSPIPID
jgi:hypothetical protein